MQNIEEIHREAMGLAERAFLVRMGQGTEDELALIRQAYEKEREAALALKDNNDLEPTRSVLFRSAATLAHQCGEEREAERLISFGLAGDPPEEIAEELRDLLEEVHFSRHLSVRGIKLYSNELQMSIFDGDAIGLGIAKVQEFVKRLQNLEKMIYRAIEKLMNRPYRLREKVPKEIAEKYEVYGSVPKAASFAVSVRIGRSTQPPLPGVKHKEPDENEVLNYLIDCLELFNAGRLDDLKQRISENDYYDNFKGLARNIAPDGKRVKHVGITALNDHRERKLILNPVKSESIEAVVHLNISSRSMADKITGILLFADAIDISKNKIKIIDENQLPHLITVPPGLMADIVRPLFGSKVIVSCTRKGTSLILENIEAAEND